MKKLIFFLFGSLLMVHTLFGQDATEPSIELNKVKNAVDALFILEQSVTEAEKQISVDAAPISKYTEIIASCKSLDSLKSFSYKFSIGFQPAPFVNSSIVTYEAIYKANSKILKIYELERASKITPGYGTITDPSKYWNSFQRGFNLGQICEEKMKVIEGEFIMELQKNRDDSTWRKGKIAKIRAEENAIAKANAQVDAARQKRYDDFVLNRLPAIKEASLTWEEGDKIRLFTWNGFYEMESSTQAFFEKYNEAKTKAKLLINEAGNKSYQGMELKKNDYIWINLSTQFELDINGSFYYWRKS